MASIKRVRTGCWTCKKRRRKCDEAKPICYNCSKTGRTCEGYGIKLSFDVDDSRNSKDIKVNSKGQMIHGFRGRPRLKESLAKRSSLEKEVLPLLTPERSATDESITNGSESPPVASTLKDIASTKSTNEEVKSKNTDSPSTTDEVHRKAIDVAFVELTRPNDSKSGGMMEDFHLFQEIFPSLMDHEEIAPLIENLSGNISTINGQNPTNVPNTAYEDCANDGVQQQALSEFEENMMLKHFFKKLLPILDAHPSSPWPQLALKYCDFEVAKSCFIALSCMHLYEQKGASEFYNRGMTFINSTMEYLIDYLKDKSENHDIEDSNILDVKTIISNLRKQPLEKQRSNFFVILLLIHVHLLFSVVESGRSALVRTFFEVFAAIVKVSSFRDYLETIDESSTLIANLSWFDTITAVVSPDCRLPYCEESWYGNKDSPSSTTKLMGCPGEIMACISRFCHLRREFKENNGAVDKIDKKFTDIKFDLLNYREYVVFDKSTTEYEYVMRLKCAQCWSLAALANLHILVHPREKSRTNGYINEFISVYNSMESTSPLITQMVWPVFTIACMSSSSYQIENTKKFMDSLYANAKMGTNHTIKLIAEQCWNTGHTWEEILASKEWLESGIDFLCV